MISITRYKSSWTTWRCLQVKCQQLPEFLQNLRAPFVCGQGYTTSTSDSKFDVLLRHTDGCIALTSPWLTSDRLKELCLFITTHHLWHGVPFTVLFLTCFEYGCARVNEPSALVHSLCLQIHLMLSSHLLLGLMIFLCGFSAKMLYEILIFLIIYHIVSHHITECTTVCVILWRQPNRESACCLFRSACSFLKFCLHFGIPN